ncbi:MAG: TRAP transporter small permease [Candidatus Methylomirabilales bacterium]
MVRRLSRLSEAVDRAVWLLAVPVGLATILIVFFEVLMRYVFRAPLITSVEISRIGFVWSCFLGAALGVKRARHIRFVFLLERLPAAGRRVLGTAVSLACTGFFLVVLVQGASMVQRVADTYFPALGLSQLWLYLPLPLTAACMLVHTLAAAAATLGEPRDPA